MDYEEEWEFLPDPRFLDFPEESEKKIFTGKRSSYLNSVFDMNYFVCPSSTESQKTMETSAGNCRKIAKQFVPVPIQLKAAAILKGREEEEEDDDDCELNLMTKEVSKKPVDVSFVPSAITEKIKGSNIESVNDSDQDAVSQVFFKKFVDMKTLDSPKSPRNIIPQVDQSAAMENTNPCSPRKMKNKNKNMDFDANKVQENQISWEEQNNLGLNIWKWSLTGIGAICSFGVAAATICIIIFGNQNRNKHQQQNQKHRFQIYSDDKISMKQAVQHATIVNEAISAVRGVPITSAHNT